MQLNIDKAKCPAATDKWACRACIDQIGVELDIMLSGAGALVIPDDSDFTRRFDDRDSRKTFITRAVRQCPHHALSIGD